MRILGIDPGSRLTGYGVVDRVGNSIVPVTHGTLKLSGTSGKQDVALEERLLLLHQGLNEVIRLHRPKIMVVEKVFFAKNAVAALKLGQARGAAILTGMIHGLEIFEYSPNEVKQAIVGQGHADKDQVARMLQILVGKQEFATSDASDGLALAVCHAQTLRFSAASRGTSALTPAATQLAEALKSVGGGRKKKRLSLAEAVGVVDAGGKLKTK